jgi:hypothetical protein
MASWKVKSLEEQYRDLSEKYRGLRKEDLEKMNPSFSCIICKKFKECGTVGHACPDAEPATEEEFASWYSF